MADRLFKQFQGTIEQGVVKLFGKVTFGASGAVSSSTTKGASIAKTAAETGRYTVTLEDSYIGGLLSFCGCMAIAADAAAGTDGYLVAIRNVAVTGSTPTFDIQVTDAAGADTNPASGFVLYYEVTLKNSEGF